MQGAPPAAWRAAVRYAASHADIRISENAPTVTIYHPEKKLSKEFTFHRICGDNIPQGEFSETLVGEIMGTCRQNGTSTLMQERAVLC